MITVLTLLILIYIYKYTPEQHVHFKNFYLIESVKHFVVKSLKVLKRSSLQYKNAFLLETQIFFNKRINVLTTIYWTRLGKDAVIYRPLVNPFDTKELNY